MLSMADSGTWQKAEIPPYKHTIAPYVTTMADLPSQIVYGSWEKIRHAIPPCQSHGLYLIAL